MTDAHLSTDEDIAKVTNGGTLIGPETVRRYAAFPTGERPRMYAYLRSGVYAGQIVTIASEYDAGRYAADAQFYWVSRTTLADLIHRA